MNAIPFKTATPPGKVIIPKPDAVPMKVMAKVSNLPKGREGFLMWLEKAYPAAYNRIAIQAPGVFDLNNTLEASLGDIVDPTSTVGASSSWADTIKNIVSPLLQVYQQKKLVDLQLDRARSGLAPLDIADYQDISSVKVGLDSSTKKILGLSGGAIAIGAIGIFALYMLMNRKRR